MSGRPAWAIGARTGPVRNFINLKVFACEGLICVIDEREGSKEGEYNVVTPADMKERITALNRMYRNQTRADLNKWQKQEHDTRKQGIMNCNECIKEAKAMGDPTDPKVQAFWSRHRRSNSVRINFSPGSDPAGYPPLPPIPGAKKETRQVPGYRVPSHKERSVPAIRKKPRKKKRSGIIMLD